jgi:predicted acetyltransferase
LIEIIELDRKNLNSIHNLWIINSKYHSGISMHFNNEPFSDNFIERIESWTKLEQIKATIINDDDTVGYCVSSIDNGIGTIESIFIINIYRNKGIGTKIIKEHIKWMQNNECKRIQVSTVYGNEEAIQFYKRMKIYPRSINLVLRNEEE